MRIYDSEYLICSEIFNGGPFKTFVTMLMSTNSNEENDSEPMSLNSSPIINDTRLTTKVQHSEISSSQRGVTNFYSIHEIPLKYRHIFSSYPCFNAVQSKVFNDVFYSDASVVVSAPTGSGKTVIFELAIVRLLINLDDTEQSQDFKIVYMAPIKALCSERYLDWKAKFSSLGLKCLEITGDTNEFDLNKLTAFHLLLTTPEKWDSLTRKWKDNCFMVQMVKLFLIDEVHLLNEEKRGPILEVVVSRMKTIQEVITVNKRQTQEYCSKGDKNESSRIRFMAISATIPNIEDVAQWLGTSHDNPAIYSKMSEDMRPVKLKKVVMGYSRPVGISQFRFEMSMSYKLQPLLFKYAEGKPTLIFCSTRKGVEQTCTILVQQITFYNNSEQNQRLTEIALTINENKLKGYVMAGVGYHHAGMLKEDRQTVEYLFREGLLPVLVTTSTLAMGVNMPAHLVIIKATQHYVNGSYHDYSETQILQMIGRAGRPQFDDSATAIIMTQESHRCHYENLVSGKEPIESNLHKHLVEHLNSEVVLRTVTDIGYAMEWIRSTFLYVRALKNPTHYGISAKCNKKNIEINLQEMCNRELNALASAKLITLDVMDIKPTSDGILMARYYLRLGTMKTFSKISGTENLESIIQIVATCPEFSEIHLRVSEKKNLNLLNKSQDHNCVRFPLPTRITTKELKVNCLIQALLGCLQVHEPSLKQDMLQISWTGKRVANGLVQYLRQHPHYKALLSAVTLAKCFHCKLWENSPYVSRQLKGIGIALSAMLVTSNKTTFQSIVNSNPRDIESIINRPPPMGDNLIYAVSHLPRFELNIDTEKMKSSTKLKVHISISNHDLVEQENTAGYNHWLTLIVGDSNNNCLFNERFKDEILLTKETSCWTIEIHNSSDIREVYLDLISEQWVGLDIHASLTLNESEKTVSQGMNSYNRNSRSVKGHKAKADSVRKKNTRTSIVEMIKEISEKRLGLTPTCKLQKFAFTPRRKIESENGNNTNTVDSCITNRCPEMQNISHSVSSTDKYLTNEIFRKHVYKNPQSRINETDNTALFNENNTANIDNFGDANYENVLLSGSRPMENIHDSLITIDGVTKHNNFNENITCEDMNETYSYKEISRNSPLLQHTHVMNKSSDSVDRIQSGEDESDFLTTDITAVSNDISLTENISERVLNLPKTLPEHYYPIFNKFPHMTPDSNVISQPLHMKVFHNMENHCSENLINGTETRTHPLCETNNISQEKTDIREVIKYTNLEKNKKPTKYSSMTDSTNVKLQYIQQNQNEVIDDREFKTEYPEQRKTSITLPTLNFKLIDDFDTFFDDIDQHEGNSDKELSNSYDNINSDIIYSRVKNVESILHEKPISNTTETEYSDDADSVLWNSTNKTTKTELSYKNMSDQRPNLWKKSQYMANMCATPARIDIYSEKRNKQLNPALPSRMSQLDNSSLNPSNRNNALKMSEDNIFDIQNILKNKNDPSHHVPTLTNEYRSRISEMPILKHDTDAQIFKAKKLTSQCKIYKYDENSISEKELTKISKYGNTKSSDTLPSKQKSQDSYTKNEVQNIPSIEYERTCSSPIRQNFPVQSSQSYNIRNIDSRNFDTSNNFIDDFSNHYNIYTHNKHVELLPESLNKSITQVALPTNINNYREFMELHPEARKAFKQQEPRENNTQLSPFKTVTKSHAMLLKQKRDKLIDPKFEVTKPFTQLKSSRVCTQFSPFMYKTQSEMAMPHFNNYSEQKYNEFIEPQYKGRKVSTQLNSKEDFTQFSSKTQLAAIPTNINNYTEPTDTESQARNQFSQHKNKTLPESESITYDTTKKAVFHKSTKNFAQTPQKCTSWERYLQIKDDPSENDMVSQSINVCFSSAEEYYNELRLNKAKIPECDFSGYTSKTPSKESLKGHTHNKQNISSLNKSKIFNANKTTSNSQYSTQMVTDSNDIMRAATNSQNNSYGYSLLQSTLEVTDVDNLSVSSEHSSTSNISSPTKKKCSDVNSKEDAYYRIQE